MAEWPGQLTAGLLLKDDKCIQLTLEPMRLKPTESNMSVCDSLAVEEIIFTLLVLVVKGLMT